MWTPDGRYLVYIVSETASNGIATQGGIATTMSLWAVSLRDQDRDPMNRDVDNEAQGLAAEAAARGRGAGGGGGGAAATPPTVTIDWNNLARRARQVPVPGDNLGGLVASPTANSVVLTVGAGGGRGGGRGGAPDATAGLYIVNIDNGQTTRVPPVPEAAGGGGGGRGRGAAAAGGGGSRHPGLHARRAHAVLPIRHRALRLHAAGRPGRRRERGSSGGGQVAVDVASAAAEVQAPRRRQRTTGGGQPPRQVTYTATIQVDRRALRKQVFNEGWRIMKNRFYDAEMHTVNWPSMRTVYEPLVDFVVDQEELQSVMMMMIGELNASHTGVSGGPSDAGPSTGQTRQPGFLIKSDPSGFYRVGHIFKSGPADHDYLKIAEGHYIISLDGRDLKTTDNYWQYLTLASSNKLRFMLNDKPVKDGAWEVVITPGGNFGDLQYAKWVEDRRQMVEKLSNGEIGYLHIRAMDAPSLRQFQLDLAANRTKKALVIDQRFNGGGGIDQELLADPLRPRLSVHVGARRGRAAAAAAELLRTDGRDAERTIGVRRRDVPGRLQGARARQDRSVCRRRARSSGRARTRCSTARRSGRRARACGRRRDRTWRTTASRRTCSIDNTPTDFLQGRDAQIEKAVEVLKQELAAGVKK